MTFALWLTACRRGAVLPGIGVAILGLLGAPNVSGQHPQLTAATFGSPTVYPTISNGTAFDIASGDFTGSHVKDIVVANGAGASVSLLVGHGDGTFAPAVTVYSSQGRSVTAIAAGDFNGDGRLDIAIVVEGGATQDVVILLGDGRRRFRESAVSALRSLAQDGPIIFGGIRSIALGSFTSRDTLDVAVTDGVNYVSVFPGDGHGGLGARLDILASALPSSILIADLYNQGNSDIGIVDRDSSSVYTIAGHGDGTFASRQRTPLGALPLNAAPVSLTFGDFRGIGRTDLFAVYSALPTASNAVGKILLSNGNGTYAQAVNLPVTPISGGGFPWAAAVADFNGDGVLDVAVAVESFPTQNDVIVLAGKGDGTFPTSADTSALLTSGGLLIPVKIVVDDFNGDGKPDIAVALDRTNGMGVGVLVNTTSQSMLVR